MRYKTQKRRRKQVGLPMSPALKSDLQQIADSITVDGGPATTSATTLPLAALINAACEQLVARWQINQTLVLAGATMALYGATIDGATGMSLATAAELTYEEQGRRNERGEDVDEDVVGQDVLERYYRSLEDGAVVEMRSAFYSPPEANAYQDRDLKLHREQGRDWLSATDESRPLVLSVDRYGDIHPWDLRRVVD